MTPLADAKQLIICNVGDCSEEQWKRKHTIGHEKQCQI
jgi:hypothetical protein